MDSDTSYRRKVYFTLSFTLTTLPLFGLALSICKYARHLRALRSFAFRSEGCFRCFNLKGQEKQRASTKSENPATWMFLHITKKRAGNLRAQQVFYSYQ